jgi:2-oxoglutarate/2-oxoacid ferredoxin oxidoreductase subunit alpha
LKSEKKMVEKRLKKENVIRAEIVPPEYFGPDKPETLLICWGSTLGPAMEASQKADRQSMGVLHFSQVWPLEPKNFQGYIETARDVFFVESNATAQLARLIECSVKPAQASYILRYDGLPLDAGYILDRLGRLLQGRNKGGRFQVSKDRGQRSERGYAPTCHCEKGATLRRNLLRVSRKLLS